MSQSQLVLPDETLRHASQITQNEKTQIELHLICHFRDSSQKSPADLRSPLVRASDWLRMAPPQSCY